MIERTRERAVSDLECFSISNKLGYVGDAGVYEPVG
jgi:hypothetical protein